LVGVMGWWKAVNKPVTETRAVKRLLNAI
jgi:hypothetical protein